MQEHAGPRLSLRQINARFEPADKIEPINSGLVEIRLAHLNLGLKDQRHPQIRRAANPHPKEIGWSDADYRKGLTVQKYFLVEYLRIAVPLFFPEGITQHRRRRRAGPIIRGSDHA